MSKSKHSSSSLRYPYHLEIGDYETSRCPGKVAPRAHLSNLLRICIELVGTDAYTGDHCAEHIHAPRHRSNHVVLYTLQSETQDHEPGYYERQRKVNYRETGFRLETALVTADIELSEAVVEKMA